MPTLICYAVGCALVSAMCDVLFLNFMFCTPCMFLKNIALPKFSKGGDCCSFWIGCIIKNKNGGFKMFWSRRTLMGTDVPLLCNICPLSAE